MERQKLRTVMRCLEIALHPNTRDEEIVAAVHGFRRTVGTASFPEICLEFARTNDPQGCAPEWHQQLHRLGRENLALQRDIEALRNLESLTGSRISEANERIRELEDELDAARRRARDAEKQTAEVKAAYRTVTDELRRQIVELHRPNRSPASAQAATPSPVEATSFAALLKAARDTATPTLLPRRNARNNLIRTCEKTQNRCRKTP